jgi:hypothetical protein
MMNQTISLSLLATFTACAADANETAYQFGLTGDQLLDIKHVATAPMTDAEWLDAHLGDFDCARYGDLCQMVGRDAAFDVIELGYVLALEGADRDAIRQAQDEAIGPAKVAWENSPDQIVPYNTATNFRYGGSTNKRIKIQAHATKMWPSLELRASGECTHQKNTFGWLPVGTAVMFARLTATFRASGNTVVETAGVSTPSAGIATIFVPVDGAPGGAVQMTADDLTSSVFCSATDGLWSASGTVVVDI